MSKEILVIRHAKAAAAGDGASDFDRPLRRRGRSDALALARALAQSGWRPDLILCSPARRARETLAPTYEHLADNVEASFEPGLYLAEASDLLIRLQRIPDTKNAVLLVGHNPGLQQLVLMLAMPARSKFRAQVAEAFPTAAAARLRFTAREWSALAPGMASLVDFQATPSGATSRTVPGR